MIKSVGTLECQTVVSPVEEAACGGVFPALLATPGTVEVYKYLNLWNTVVVIILMSLPLLMSVTV